MKKIFLITFAAFLFMGINTFAQTKTPKLTDKQIKQTKRIHQGVKSGELTRFETKQLMKQKRKLQKHKMIAKSDGVVTPKERARLNAQANRLNKNIYKQKHDSQKRR
jgi:CRISPR/Cas system CMR-associated protein Cmr3 (group 5 of RAMP superfamily)